MAAGDPDTEDHSPCLASSGALCSVGLQGRLENGWRTLHSPKLPASHHVEVALPKVAGGGVEGNGLQALVSTPHEG